MRVIDLEIEGPKLIELKAFPDERGFFVERFNEAKFIKAGLPHNFVQDNHSKSKKGVIRGLHYQYDPPQGKLVGAISGTIWDVAVDIRPQSKTFGKHVGVELSGENMRLLWLPAGFAHGFCVTSDEGADVIYKVNAIYSAKGEGGIRWDDPKLNIQWPVKDPIISAKDQELASFDDFVMSAVAKTKWW